MIDQKRFIQFILLDAEDIPEAPARKVNFFFNLEGLASIKNSDGEVIELGTGTDDGGSGEIEIADTITGDPGTDASVTLNEDGALVFTIPRGEDGLDGAPGDEGPEGPQGPAGDDGADGVGPARANFAHTTASLANGAIENYDWAIGKSATLLRVTTDVPARVRLYATSAARTADAARALGVYPSPGEAVLADFATVSALVIKPGPVPILYNGDDTPTSTIYAAITNLDTGPNTVTVTLSCSASIEA